MRKMSVRKPGSVGKPVFHAEVRIVDRAGRPCQPGQVGEIVVRGSIMMTEYWQDPVRSEETIRGGWLHTGDLARMDEDGYFYLIDRVKDMFISGGENVYPAEVERVLRKHADVEDIAVVGVPDETWGEVGYAFVITKPGANPAPDDLINFCDGRLARYKWPKKIYIRRGFSPHRARKSAQKRAQAAIPGDEKQLIFFSNFDRFNLLRCVNHILRFTFISDADHQDCKRRK